MLVARDDPLDTYLVHHPEALFGQPVEATVLDPGNPYVLAPHLCAAAAELPPLRDEELAGFAPDAAPVADHLVGRGLLRRRAAGCTGPGPSGPATWPTSAAPAAGRSGWSRRAPGGCSARSTVRRRTRRCTPARSTCTRA